MQPNDVHTIHPMLTTAVKAARRAGNLINRATRDLGVLTVRAKGAHDFVSEVDTEAERVIVETLKQAYPDHAIRSSTIRIATISSPPAAAAAHS
jgi:fructose-1,6-bisphosphatase/inositol monophosphatase family enzyme